MNITAYLQFLFIPHRSNNHRPKVLQIDTLFLWIFMFLLFNLGLRTIHWRLPDVLGYATDIRVEQLLSFTNKKRQEAGFEPLVLNTTLSRAASAKAADMFSKNYWAHNSPGGIKPWDFIVNAGYNYTLAGENLAKNFSTSQNVVDAWMNSPSHRDNLLKKDYRDVGFAVVNGIINGEETTLVVQMFGSAGEAKIASKPVQTANKKTDLFQNNPKTAESEVKEANTSLFVNKTPLINLPTLTREIAFIFIGILIGILFVDALITGRRKTTRLAGHNFAHIMFFVFLLIILTRVSQGVLL